MWGHTLTEGLHASAAAVAAAITLALGYSIRYQALAVLGV